MLCLQQYNPSCVPWLTSALRRLYTLTTSHLYRRVACCSFARSPLFLRCSLPKRSNFSVAFAKFAYAVPSESYTVAKSAVFPIDRNSEYPKMAQECTPDVDVTVINENCITQCYLKRTISFNFLLCRELVMTVNVTVQERNATCRIIASAESSTR